MLDLLPNRKWMFYLELTPISFSGSFSVLDLGRSFSLSSDLGPLCSRRRPLWERCPGFDGTAHKFGRLLGLRGRVHRHDRRGADRRRVVGRRHVVGRRDLGRVHLRGDAPGLVLLGFLVPGNRQLPSTISTKYSMACQKWSFFLRSYVAERQSS